MIAQLQQLKKLQINFEKIYQDYQVELTENKNQLHQYQKLVSKKLAENTILPEIPIITLKYLKNRLNLRNNFKSLPHIYQIRNLSAYQCILDQIRFNQMDFFWFWSLVSNHFDVNPISPHLIHQYLDIHFFKNYTYEDFSSINKPILKSWKSNFKSFQIKIHNLRQEFQIQKNYESTDRKEKLKKCQLERDYWLTFLQSKNLGINQLYPEKICKWLENIKEDKSKLNFEKSEDIEKLVEIWIQKKELVCQIEIFPQVLKNYKIKIDELLPELKKIEQHLINQKQNKIQLRNKKIINLKKQCGSQESDDLNTLNSKYWKKQIQEKEYVLKFKLQEIKKLKKSNTQIDEKITSYQIETYGKNHLLHDRIHKITQDLENTKNLNLEKIKNHEETKKHIRNQIQKFKKYLMEISISKNTHLTIKKEMDIEENDKPLHLLQLQKNILELTKLESNYHQEYLTKQKNLEKLEKSYLTLRNKFIDKNEFIWLELEKKKYVIQKVQQLEKQIDTYQHLEKHHLDKKVIEYQTYVKNITSQFNFELELENKHPDTSKICYEIQKNISQFLTVYFWILVSKDLNIFIDWDTWNTKHYQYFLNLEIEFQNYTHKIKELNYTNKKK